SSRSSFRTVLSQSHSESTVRNDDRDDDYDEPTFPGVVKAAGWIWIIIGGLQVLSGILMTVMMTAKGPKGALLPSIGIGLFPAVIGLAILWCGRQTIAGKAR